MLIENLTENKFDYVCAVCLDPSIDANMRKIMSNSMNDRILWIKDMKQKKLGIIIALEEPETRKIKYKWVGEILHSDLAVHGKVPKGLLEYIPIEFALEPVKGKNILFINCMWVLPPFWDSGVAKCLIEYFITIAKQNGGACVIAFEDDKWFGTSIKYMPANFFKKFGFKEVERDGSRILLFLDLGVKEPPKFVFPKIISCSEKDITIIDLFYNSQCPWSQFMVHEFITNIKKFSGIYFNLIKTDDRKIIEKYGISRGLSINGIPVINRMASWKEMKTEIKKFRRLNIL
ncbi:MAG: hypothetical protein ACXAC2_06020 [Candidatus Kariarchaeaceae archaeon]|jgi:GNAT superfamily N-acetyltransferase